MKAVSYKLNLQKYFKAINETTITGDHGKIVQVTGFLLKGYMPESVLGSVCDIYPMYSKEKFEAEVVGFQDRSILLMPLGEMRGVGLGSRIVMQKTQSSVFVGTELLGRVVDGMGRPIDGLQPLTNLDEVPIYSESYNPLFRPPIRDPIQLGVRAIDGLLTVGQGQRIAIMAGSGVGKSVLLGQIAKNTDADINVIALIGERGREVREFVEHNLGPEGLKKSVVVVATSDQSPLLRMRGAFVAAAIANFFSDQGKNVLFMMDSVTRFAMAQREIGLNVGEPPASKGYTPSVFSLLPKLLERAGTFENKGSITGLFTVLVEGDDMDDPIGDAVRSITDGHVVLDRGLAQKGHFPAIDILQSTSRVMRNVVDEDHMRMAILMRESLASYRQAEDLINIGAYKTGFNPKIDRAVKLNEPIEQFLKQGVNETSNFQETHRRMERVLRDEL